MYGDEKRNRFSQKLTDILNHGALNLAMGIGYELGLFECMDRLSAPASPSDIAEQAGLSERYVREWLGIMVTGGVVELHESGEDDFFFLPKEHADFLARRAGNSNMGVYMQEIPLLTSCAREGVLKGFRTGEGVPYEAYPAFQGFMGELADAKHHSVLIDTFLPSVNHGRIVEQLKSGIQVCDIGCAQGLVLRLMAKAFPESFYIGYDISDEAIASAREMAAREGLSNVRFEVRDVAGLSCKPEFGNMFDYVMSFDSIHDQTRPANALQSVRHILKTDGSFSMIDIAAESRLAENLNHPMAPFLYAVSLMHCMPVGLVDGGEGLGMMWGREKAVTMLQEAGFGGVEVNSIPEDSFNLHYFCKCS